MSYDFRALENFSEGFTADKFDCPSNAQNN